MSTIFLFAATVLIWGSTWIAISAQVGSVPLVQSIFLRFAVAAIIMLAGLAALGRLKRPAQWRFVIAQALCLFCFNFVGLYHAAALMPSGLVSVVFSLASILNAANARIFFGDRITPRTICAGVIGVLGLALLFRDDLTGTANLQTLRGIGWALLGTMMFSLGNMASRRNAQLGVTPTTANAWGMGIGALVLLALVGLSGQGMVWPETGRYWVALAYLSVIGTVIGFTTYLLLVARLGSARAGYATVVFPVVALLLSTFYEGYHWTPSAAAGLCLTLLGNVVMFGRGLPLPRGMKRAT
ncbi:DMT family transporter [Paracoccus sp. CPCC 101403]|uniref:DMT family transporter n=1 Tax=Paracoccus broussonetiae TaxID=3075834 RepID=A0ABU3EGP1_9RHOB|nr:DMT family transporter [Paracoccus sp. CPCC 101403]MDT1062615.1 DMT family transporter [Paracoccus sp. CPCC 101403]